MLAWLQMVDFKFIGRYWFICHKLQFKLVRTAKTVSMETRVLALFVLVLLFKAELPRQAAEHHG